MSMRSGNGGSISHQSRTEHTKRQRMTSSSHKHTKMCGFNALRAVNPLIRRGLKQYASDGMTKLCHIDPFIECENLPAGELVPEDSIFQFQGGKREEDEMSDLARSANTASSLRMQEPPSYVFSFSTLLSATTTTPPPPSSSSIAALNEGCTLDRGNVWTLEDLKQSRDDQKMRDTASGETDSRAVCWWDCHPFDWTPFPLPIKYKRDVSKHGLKMRGGDENKRKKCGSGYFGRYFDPDSRKVLPNSAFLHPRTSSSSSGVSQNPPSVRCRDTGDARKEQNRKQNPDEQIRERWAKSKYNPENVEFECVGCFCGPSCAIAYAVHERMDRVVPNIYTLARALGYLGTSPELRELHHDSHSGEHITTAPPRECLRMFNGRPDGLSITKFRELCICGIEVRVRDPVFVTRLQVVEAEQKTAAKAVQTNASGAYHKEDPLDTCGKSVIELVRDSNATARPMHGTLALSTFF